jgi:hypothetical protein
MSKLPDKPTNKQFLSSSLSELGEWFKQHDIKSMLGITCIYCGGDASETDHVIPKSRGGKKISSNEVPSCSNCNSSKSTMTPKEWIGIDNDTIYFGSPRHIEFAQARMDKLQ